MNREERRADRKAQEQKAKQIATPKPNTTAATPPPVTNAPRRPFALWTVGILVAFVALFGLWGESEAMVSTKNGNANDSIACTVTTIEPYTYETVCD
ncbi:MAG: hypothetical protein SFU56_11050 [Capsulimonadales bacterium]|nr:hypothetical protein [Capsulimonadales bacterium]